MEITKTFKQLQTVLELTPQCADEVMANKPIVKFRPKTATYSVSLTFAYGTRESIVTFKSSGAYPCIFVGSTIDSCIEKARVHYSAENKF